MVLSLASSLASAQMPPDLAQQLIAIGPVINAAATAALYAPRIAEKEPYVSLSVERDLAYGPDERNLLDVFAPTGDAGKARPVLVFVHGGAFVGGNRRTGSASPFYDNVLRQAATGRVPVLPSRGWSAAMRNGPDFEGSMTAM